LSASTQYPCPCCGYLTLDETPPGTFNICEVCFWEDDNVAFDDPDFAGGANVVSLNTARDNFKKFRASDERWVTVVRPPLGHEVPDGRIEPPRIPSDRVIGAFWDWFAIYASKLAANDPEILKVLDERVSLLGEITWTIERGEGERVGLVLSPGESQRIAVTRRIIELAPTIAAWDFSSTEPLA
jgi:Cysteine-rich CPCC